MKYVDVSLTAEMIKYARDAILDTRVNRTVASPIDTLTGLLGELAFAQWFLGDWKNHDLRGTKGRPDFLNEIEIKTSAFPFRDSLNLLVREDYAQKRKPSCYVQVILDAPQNYVDDVKVGWNCRISGWATSAEVDAAPLRDFGKKGGGRGGYRCHHIQIKDLRPMADFPIRVQK
jgi:hypothetical protein